MAARWAARVLLGVRAGVAFEIAGTEGGTLATGGEICVSACTVRVVNITTKMANTREASTREETLANSQIRSGAFRLGKPDLRRITILLCY
jgi:hypothetical protein